MTQPNPYIASQFRQVIYHHLDNNNLDNALFVAGRLFAYEPRSQEASHLVALCYLRLGQYKSSYDYSRPSGSKGINLGCVYVFGQACLALGRFQEGIKALNLARGLWISRNNWNKHSESTRQAHPDAAAVWCLMGKLRYGSRDIQRAIDCYTESLKLNPFMWDAFMGLCQSGASVRVQNIFKANPAMLAMLSSSNDASTNQLNIHDETGGSKGSLQSHRSNASLSNASDPFGATHGKSSGTGMLGMGSSGLFRKFNESTLGGFQSFTSTGSLRSRTAEPAETPTGLDRETASIGSNSDTTTVVEPPPAPSRRPRAVHSAQPESLPDAPRLRNGISRTRNRLKPEDYESETAAGTTNAGITNGERKRNISGQTAQSNIARLVEPPQAPQRRSDRLLNQIRPISSKFSSAAAVAGGKDGRELKRAKAPGARSKVGAATSNVGRAISGNRKAPTDPMDIDAKDQSYRSTTAPPITSADLPKNPSDDQVRQQEALQWLLELFRHLGDGHYYQTHYACDLAIKSFGQLPTPQRETPAVLAQIGRAYYEQANYAEAEEYFAKIRVIAPNRLEDMEIYSTVLWHQKNDVELAYLSYELMDIDRLSPQAWCALGNSFSLQRDHDQALKCFKRATQADPTFAYALTLQGHEHVANEEYEKAMSAFRAAVASDVRHYNAWYGLGRVYEKMGKNDFAEKHYRTASEINPTNAVLVCCIGMVLEKQKNQVAALEQYTRAINLAPKSALARFKKARLLMGLQEPHLALEELMYLKDIAPDEANVHFLLGRLYKMLRQKANAIKHFTISLNLDPKAGPYIKQSMESLEDDEDDDEDEHMM